MTRGTRVSRVAPAFGAGGVLGCWLFIWSCLDSPEILDFPLVKASLRGTGRADAAIVASLVIAAAVVASRTAAGESTVAVRLAVQWIALPAIVFSGAWLVCRAGLSPIS